MKKYLKETVIVLLQLLLFYILPLLAGPTDAMGMVLLMLLGTLVLSFLLGCLSANRLKYAYSPVAALAFLPSIPLYYNSSAFIHALWYLVIAAIGLGLGSMLRKLILFFKS